MKEPDFVLFTTEKKYISEYLLSELILSESITEAMTFTNEENAKGFKKRIFEECNVECSVNTYIK